MNNDSERLERILSCCSEGFFELALNSNAFWCSPNLAAVLGLERTQTPGSIDDLFQAFDLRHADELSHTKISLLEGSQKFGLKRFRLKGDGTSKGEVEFRFLKNLEAQVVSGSVQRIEPGKTSSSAFDQREEILHAILDTTTAVIFAKDRQGRYLFMNQRFRELFRIEGEYLGKDDYQIFPVEAAEKFQRVDRMVLEGGEKVELLEQAPQDDGLHTYISAKMPLFDADGSIYAIAGIATDITSEQKAKEELVRIAELKSQFLANMSHEIRTPMHGVLVTAELLSSSELNDYQQGLVSTITESAESLLRIINGIFDFSKIEANKIVLSQGVVSLRALISGVEKVHGPLARKKNIEFIVDIGGDLADQYFTDGNRIVQILHNLAGNAVKFTEAGGQVTLAVRRVRSQGPEDLVEFVVNDTGIGVHPDESENIFEAFAQGDATVTRAFSGTGLGLTISARLVELMRGSIRLIEKQEEGARFEVVLPLLRFVSQGEFSGQNVSNQSEELPELRPLSVLFVEDNPINRRTLSLLLQKFGHTVECAKNGAEAVSLFKAGRYDIVLMDIQMPVMDGIEASRIIRTLEGGKAIPIIALTASAMAGDRERLMSSSINDYLAKPFGKRDLLELLVRWTS
ncbi:MAG: response regulator [Bdellovibrionales bacterium]|nr:response regulator [Bdellovibrionales bacterium]